MNKLNKIAALEKAIAEKYGKEAIQNPKADWDEQKEKEYLESLQKIYQEKQVKSEKVEVNGILLSKKLLIRDNKRQCPVCEIYSFVPKDDLYMNKFGCCHKCYVQWVEDREERWLTGWRPNAETVKEIKKKWLQS